MWRKSLNFVDGILNRVTMYRLVLYYLIFLWIAAMGLSHLGLLPYEDSALFISAFFITGVCLLVNEMFARAFKVQTNEESVYITALILTLIISPLNVFHSGVFIETALWASVIAIASKYLIAVRRKHIFNPAAFGVAATALLLGDAASWWVGTAAMLPFVLIGGLLMVRKLRRSDLVWSFLIAAAVAVLATNVGQSIGPITVLGRTFLDAPLFFFAFVMLTEPLTSPPTSRKRIAYGALVGVLFAPALHIGSVYSTPELALLIGNVFSYIVSPKQKLSLKLKQKTRIAPDMYDLVFAGGGEMSFKPGQYMEWTLGHKKPDSRGNRRYFTLASSPTERDLHLGVKFYENPSSFKRALLELKAGDMIAAGGLAGDFTLPKHRMEKLVFIAGGIGITPFRSMIKYLLDRGERRDIVVLFSNRKADNIVYAEILEEAEKKLGIRTVHTLTEELPALWRGENGFVDAKMIARTIPDWRERTFYVSGTHAMVAAVEGTLKGMGVPKKRVKTDFFPGFA